MNKDLARVGFDFCFKIMFGSQNETGMFFCKHCSLLAGFGKIWEGLGKAWVGLGIVWGRVRKRFGKSVGRKLFLE